MRTTALLLLLAGAACCAEWLDDDPELVVHTFGPADAPMHIAIVCGMHPRERFAYDLCARWTRLLADDPPVRVRITLVPDANPEGRARWEVGEPCWRGNARGVDLNRNWAWPECASDAPGDEREGVLEQPWSSGTRIASEWETRALARRMVDDAPDILLAVHSGARALLTPYDACDVSPPNFPRLMKLGNWLRRDVCDDCVLAQSPRVLYRSHGTFTDWAYAHLGVPFVYTLEAWAPPNAAAAADCVRAFSPPAGTIAYDDALAAWDLLLARLAHMDGDTWATLLRWTGRVE
jgi:hypothetical protein